MTPKNYAEQMEKKLVQEFKLKFLDKMGYLPTVLTRYKTSETGIPHLKLEELEKCFEPFLPEYKYKGRNVTLKSSCRRRELVELRQFFSAIARQMGMSLTNIGIYLNKRDHTTIIHNIRQFKNLMETDANYRSRFSIVLNYIKERHEPPVMDDFDQVQRNTQPIVLPGLSPVQD